MKLFSRLLDISFVRSFFILVKSLKRFFHLRIVKIKSKVTSYRYTNVSGLLVDYLGSPFIVSTLDQGVGKVILSNGDYQPEERRFILKDVEAGDSLLVVGANIGAHAIKLEDYFKTVVAIEADPKNYNFLNINLKINHSNIRAINIAAYNKNTEIEFLSSNVNAGGSKILPAISKDYYFFDEPSKIKIPATRLDEILTDNYSHILMDIEGSEIFALQGMPNLLVSCQNLYMEFIPHHIENVANTNLDAFYEIFHGVFNFVEIPNQEIFTLEDGFSYLREQMKQDKSIDLVRFYK